MLAGALPAMIESLGDYYACSQISGAPIPPPDVLSRAVSWQGLSCVVTGLLGTSSGTTAYNENIGAIQITRVGSRLVVQLGAGCMILLGLVGKFGGLFASLPSPLISGLFCIVFGLIAAGECGWQGEGGDGRLGALRFTNRTTFASSAFLLTAPTPLFTTNPHNIPVGLSMMVHADQRSERNIFIGELEASSHSLASSRGGRLDFIADRLT